MARNTSKRNIKMNAQHLSLVLIYLRITLHDHEECICRAKERGGAMTDTKK